MTERGRAQRAWDRMSPRLRALWVRADLARRSRQTGSALATGSRDARDAVVSRAGGLRRRSTARRRARRAFGTLGADTGPAFLLGLPVPLLLMGFIAAALVGVLVATSLTLTTQPDAAEAAAGMRDGSVGNIESSANVVTESTLGAEVQELLDAASVGTTADFDISRCLKEQGITEPMIAIEEVAWGAERTNSWLVVYGTATSESLRADGGSVNAIIVLSSCGSSTPQGSTPADNRIWTGSMLVGPTTG